VLNLSAEQFMLPLFSIARSKMMDFKEIFRSVDVLMVDDVPVHFAVRKRQHAGRFLSHATRSVTRNKQINYFGRPRPGEIKDLEDRVRRSAVCEVVCVKSATPPTMNCVCHSAKTRAMHQRKKTTGLEVEAACWNFWHTGSPPTPCA